MIHKSCGLRKISIMLICIFILHFVVLKTIFIIIYGELWYEMKKGRLQQTPSIFLILCNYSFP